MPTMIRNLHLLFGFLSIPFLLVYAVSAVFFVHPILDPSFDSSVIQEFETKPYGSNREQLFAKFLAENNIRGKISSEENFADGSSLISINHPSKSYKVTYDPAENRIQLKESTKNITGFLKALHKTSGIDNTDWELNAWGIYILIEAVLLLLIVISGIYLWLQRSRDRKSGLVFLLTSLLFGVSLLTIIRLG